MNRLPEPLLPAPCRQDLALFPTELCKSLLRRRSDSFRLSGGIVCTCFSQSTSTTSGRVADLTASWSGEGLRSVPARPCHSTPLRPRLFPSSHSPCFLSPSPSSYVSGLRTRLPDGPPSDLTQPAAVTDFSNGRALLHAAEEHVPIACSYINIRVGLRIVIIQFFIHFSEGFGDLHLKNIKEVTFQEPRWTLEIE